VATNHEECGARSRSEKIGDFVSIYQRGSVWWMNYQSADGKQVRKSLKTKSKKQAKLLAHRKDGELLQGRDSADVVIATIGDTVAAYDAYLVAEERSPKTLQKYRKLFSRVTDLGTDRHVRDMRGITLSFVDAYRRMRHDAGRAPRTIHNETTILRQLVNFALCRNMLDHDRLSRG